MSTATLAASGPEPNLTIPSGSRETDEALFEVVHSQRVEMPPMSIRAVTVVTRLVTVLNTFAKSRQLGEAFAEMLIGMPVPEDEGRSRRPDVCFVSSTTLADASPEDPDANAWDVVPDLVIEVTSPTDRAEAQREKVLDYFRLGVRCVWVVYPKLRLVDVFESPTSLRVFGPDDTLAGDPVLPGFELRLAELFGPIAPPRP